MRLEHAGRLAWCWRASADACYDGPRASVGHAAISNRCGAVHGGLPRHGSLKSVSTNARTGNR